jgi:ABC-type lipoprotein release transport system permease subunit
MEVRFGEVRTVAAGLLALAVLAASYFPARRAGRLDPAETQRCDG